MNKYFITLAEYPDNRQNLYETYNAPRIREYCKLHGFKFIEVTPKTSSVPQPIVIPHDLSNDKRFSRWWLINEAIEAGKLKEGDIVTYTDCDVFIAKLDQPLITNKSFTYAIDSGNSHNTGLFSLKVNDYTKKLIKAILSKERYEQLRNYPIWKENFNGYHPLYDHDQDAYYHCVGLPAHSWVPYFDLPNYGFHTRKENTIFELDEIMDNTEILPVEWNVTHLVEETGNNGVPDTYDIIRTTKDKVIARHFVGGDTSKGTGWRFKEWIDYVNAK